jgi:hypothetical protein
VTPPLPDPLPTPHCTPHQEANPHPTPYMHPSPSLRRSPPTNDYPAKEAIKSSTPLHMHYTRGAGSRDSQRHTGTNRQAGHSPQGTPHRDSTEQKLNQIQSNPLPLRGSELKARMLGPQHARKQLSFCRLSHEVLPALAPPSTSCPCPTAHPTKEPAPW